MTSPRRTTRLCRQPDRYNPCHTEEGSSSTFPIIVSDSPSHNHYGSEKSVMSDGVHVKDDDDSTPLWPLSRSFNSSRISLSCNEGAFFPTEVDDNMLIWMDTMIEDIMKKSKKKPVQKLPIAEQDSPESNLPAFLRRLHQTLGTEASAAGFIKGIKLLEILCDGLDCCILTPNTAIYLVGTLVVIGSKAHEDRVFGNDVYAVVVGLTLQDLNKLETWCLNLLEWNALPPVEIDYYPNLPAEVDDSLLSWMYMKIVYMFNMQKKRAGEVPKDLKFCKRIPNQNMRDYLSHILKVLDQVSFESSKRARERGGERRKTGTVCFIHGVKLLETLCDRNEKFLTDDTLHYLIGMLIVLSFEYSRNTNLKYEEFRKIVPLPIGDCNLGEEREDEKKVNILRLWCIAALDGDVAVSLQTYEYWKGKGIITID